MPDTTVTNVGLGAGFVGATQTGMYAATSQMNGPIPAVLATSLFLNLINQIIKKFKWFPEHEGTIIVSLILSFAIGYFLLYHGDVAQSFANMACSTFQAIMNYKGDKLTGLDIMPPTPPESEYGIPQESLAGAVVGHG